MHTVAIIGLSPAIAGDPASEHPLERGHAGALLQARGIRLLGVADAGREVREAFAMTWGTSFPLNLGYHPSIDDLCHERLPDVVTVCDPGKDPVTLFRTIAEYPLRAIVLSPPPTASLSLWDSILGIIAQKEARVCVCHPFEADPRIDLVEELARDPEWIGVPHTIVARVGTGLFTHAYGVIGILTRLFGAAPGLVTARGFLPPGDPVADLDTHPDACIQNIVLDFQKLGVGLVLGAALPEPGFSLEIHGPVGTLHFSYQDGIRLVRPGPPPKALPKIPPPRNPLAAFYERLFHALGRKRTPIPFPARDATRTLETTYAALESVIQGKPISPADADRDLRLRLKR